MSRPVAATRAGELVAGRYRLIERIGSGGMGSVWRARDELLGRPVAVKLPGPAQVESGDYLTRFRAEARLAAGLAHPGIAAVHDYGEHDGPYLVMEYVPGEPLSARLARLGRLPAADTLDLLAQAGAALQAAHDAGVVHRDIKPANLLLTPDGRVKITDFGIARAVTATTLTEAGTVLGTSYYLSPEQGRGDRAGPASDVYALGVVGYECLAGRRPFEGEHPLAVAMAHQHDDPPPLPDDVPAPAGALVLGALAKRPQDRPASAAAFAEAATEVRGRIVGDPAEQPLDEPAGGLGPRTRVFHTTATSPLTRPWRAGRPARSRLALLGIGAGLVAVLLAAVLVGRDGGGSGIHRMPRLAGRPLAGAQAALRSGGLRTAVSRVSSGRVSAGTVITTRPGPGIRVRHGALVRLIVSAGPGPVEVNPASLRGQNGFAVATMLTKLGLQVREQYTTAGGVAPGSVAGVTPSGEVARGTTVVLTVESAPAPSPPPAGGQGGPPGHRGHHHGHGQGDGPGKGQQGDD